MIQRDHAQFVPEIIPCHAKGFFIFSQVGINWKDPMLVAAWQVPNFNMVAAKAIITMYRMVTHVFQLFLSYEIHIIVHDI